MTFLTGTLIERHDKAYQSGFTIDPQVLARALATAAPAEAKA
jgi:hypothetical protein